MGVFVRRVMIVLAMVAGWGAALYLVVVGVDVLLLAFAGLLFALFLRGLAAGAAWATGLPHPTALGVVVALLVGLVALGGWLVAPAVVEQTGQLLQQLPQAVAGLRERMEASAWGRTLLPYIPSTDQLLSVERPLRAGSTVLATLGGVAGGAASAALVAFIGLYVAAAPRPYRRGLLYLVPERRHRRAERVLETLGHTLQRWLVGKVVGMLLIGSLTGIGLGVLQVPLALALGVLAGLLNFVPYIGPLISFVPAALLATMQGAGTLLWVLGLYLVIQGLESYVVTPLIQQQAVALPPAFLITAQVLLGVAIGWLGLLLATPITAAVVVLVRELYRVDEVEIVDVRGRAEEAA
jgi:predicted PurR-regulated permease PerM